MGDDTIRVCHVVNAVSTTSVPADIATGLVKHTDIQADILAWFNVESFNGMDLIQVHDIGAPNNSVGADVTSIQTARQILSQYDIIQTHHNHSGTFAKPIAYLQGTPIISTEQNNHDGFTTKGLVANAITNSLVNEITCVSETVVNSIYSWERFFCDNIRVIHNGVNLNRVEESRNQEWSVHDCVDIDTDAYLISNAGRLAKQKGLDTLIRAISQLQPSISVEAAIAGDGPLQSDLKSLAKNLGVNDSIHFLGKIDRSNVYSMMAESDAYVMPSRWEGFSAAALEALSIGVPCIFSDIDEFTTPFEGAARFHRVDDPQSLSKVLSDVLTDADQRASLVERGRKRADRYSIENVVKQYRNLYRELV